MGQPQYHASPGGDRSRKVWGCIGWGLGALVVLLAMMVTLSYPGDGGFDAEQPTVKDYAPVTRTPRQLAREDYAQITDNLNQLADISIEMSLFYSRMPKDPLAIEDWAAEGEQICIVAKQMLQALGIARLNRPEWLQTYQTILTTLDSGLADIQSALHLEQSIVSTTLYDPSAGNALADRIIALQEAGTVKVQRVAELIDQLKAQMSAAIDE